MPAPFVAALTERPLLGDGAMGTHALRARRAARRLLRRPQRQRVRSSSRASTPSTSRPAPTASRRTPSGRTASSSACTGLAARVREINRVGARLARDVRESMGRDVFVLGSIGPLGKYLAPLGSIEPDEARRGVPRAGGGAARGRRGRLRRRDLLRSHGDAAGGRGDPRAHRPAHRDPGGVHR